MRWCCGGLSEARGAVATTANGGSTNNGRRQAQLTIQGDQVVLDATTAASSLNNLHQGSSLKDEPRPSTSAEVEAYQFSSSHGRYKTTTSSHPVSISGRINSGSGEGKIIDNINQESTLLSPRNAALIMDKYGPMLLRPCKSALFVTSVSPSSTSSSSSTILDCAFLERLRQSDWQLHCCNSILANSEVQKHRPVIIILDNKLSDLTAVSRSLHALPESEDVLFGVLSDRGISDKRKRTLLKCELHEYFLSSSIDISICELFAKLAARLRAIPALFAVVEEAEQPIKICDDRNIVQYVNRAYEIQTGCSRAEVLGSDAGEIHSKAIIHTSATLPPLHPHPHHQHPPPPLHVIGSTPMNEAMEVTPTTATATTPQPQETTTGSIGNVSFPHSFNPSRRRSSEWHCITVPGSSNPQFVYVKRGSADATICRDLSLKSLRSQSALVDAPITEALTVLANVLHKCDDETQPMVRDAIKILSSNELYAPTITRFQNNDRIASGYYDGLIRLHHPSRQRKRSVVDAFREQRRTSATDSRRRISSDVVNALENEDSWHFDVIELERVTEHHPLSHLGAKIFERWNCADVLRCSGDTIARWLTVIEANYQNTNTYHNATHAADVLQATSFFLISEVVAQTVQDNHATAALIAATVHDLDHPGRGNAFLINTRQRLALLYNDQSVLENHHVALAFQLTLAQNGINIFSKMQREEFIQMRQSIIDMVLATDMSRHFEYITKFQQIIPNLPDLEENRESNSMTVCRMMIKCADIANPTREWKLCVQWAMRIVEEYFFQTAEEREKGLPLTMKGFERDTCNVPMTQCTFVDMFAREAFTLWCDFAEIPHLLQQLETNYEKWKQMSTTWEPGQNLDLISKPPA
jgi:high affinity cAMP-specific and IBMX-insensitive 3',5'-cyclic phosphodiesterase 8